MTFMKKQILTGLSTAALTLALVSGIINNVGFYSKDTGDSTSDSSPITVMTASAKSAYAKPEVTTNAVFSDTLRFIISNYKTYGSDVKILTYVGDKKVSTTTSAALKSASGKISITNDGSKKLKPNKKYKITITAQYSDGKTYSKSFSKKTSKESYWVVHKGVNVFERVNGKFVRSFKASDEVIARGELVTSACKPISGKAKSTKARYLKIQLPFENGKNSLGEMQYIYKDCYIDYKPNTKVNRKTQKQVRKIVADYATMMTKLPSQVYQLSGELVTKDRTVSDCSGMTELAYLQIGYYLEHYADRQANNYGKVIYDNLVSKGAVSGVETYSIKDQNSRVDISTLVKGDLVFFMEATNSADDNDLYVGDGIGHVGMYLGNGKMAHFTAGYGIYNHPCRIEDLKNYDSRLRVVKAVRYII